MSIAEKLTTVAQNVSRTHEVVDAYNANVSENVTKINRRLLGNSYPEGGETLYEKAVEEGKALHDRAWWDAITANGTRTGYVYAFSQIDFSNVGGFNPPIQLVPTGYSSHMFSGTKGIDKITAAQLDLSQDVSIQYLFERSSVKEIELIDSRASANITGILSENSNTHTVGKFILKSDGSQTVANSSFYTCYGLKNITFEGYFGQNVSFQYCGGLTKASITSIVNALLPTASGKTLTLSNTAVADAFGVNRQEWLDLIATKSNWTISLV